MHRRPALARGLAAIAVLGWATTVFCIDPTPAAEVTDADDCVAPATWFPVTPEPYDAGTFETNCQFHQWAYQEFLWLSQPDLPGGPPRFLTLAPARQLFPASGSPPPYAPEGIAEDRHVRPLTVSSRRGKVDANGVGQAGDGEMLVDQNGNPVYYGAAVNKVYYDFVRSNGFYRETNLNAVKPGEPNSAWPVGALEIKTAWAIASANGRTYIPNASSSYFTTEAMIGAPKVVETSAGYAWAEDTANPFTATLALIGMHVVGRVQGHPEFIWGTFEHTDLDPQCSLLSAAAVTAGKPATAPSGGPWLLYAPGTPSAECNKGIRPAMPQPPIKPTSVCTEHPWGGGSDDNQANIMHLNHSVESQLAKDSVWRNYFMAGSVWTTGQVPTILDISKISRGSVELANSTMESFSQTSNCFKCHHKALPGATSAQPWEKTDLAVSHLLHLAQEDKKVTARLTAMLARVPSFEEVKDTCFTPSAAQQKQCNITPDNWRKCMQSAVGIDIWNEQQVLSVKDLINQEISTNDMPPAASCGPLTRDQKAVWTAWYNAQ